MNKQKPVLKKLEFKLNKQMETFLFTPPINFSQELKSLLGVTSFEATISLFNIIVENNRFSITTPSNWTQEGGKEFITKMKK